MYTIGSGANPWQIYDFPSDGNSDIGYISHR